MKQLLKGGAALSVRVTQLNALSTAQFYVTRYQNGDGVATKSYVGPISTSSYRLKIVVRVLSSTFLLSLVAFAFRQGYLEMSSGSRRSEVSKGSFSSQLHKF